MPRYAFPIPAKPPRHIVGAGRLIVDGISSLERDYPRVLQAVQALWGHQELNIYFRKITMDDRGNREGFPPDVWEEIYMLLRLHQEIVPEFSTQTPYRLR